MGFFSSRKKKGHEYVYYEERAWKDGKVIRSFQKYLGPRDWFPDELFGKHKVLTPDDYETETFTFGLSAALWQIAQELNLEQVFNSALGKPSHANIGSYLLLTAINRLVAPCSKTELFDWFQTDWISIQVPEKRCLLNARVHWDLCQDLTSDDFEKIELEMGKLLQEKYGLSHDQLLYDTTNIFTYAAPDGPGGLRNNGHSKQNQNDLPLIQYYLLCSKPWGFPLLHYTYTGNTQDAETFKTVPAKVTDHWHQLGYDPANITLTFDKGNLSPEGFKELDARKLKFIASLRNSTQKALLQRPLSDFTTVTLPVSKKQVEYLQETRKIYEKNRTVLVVIDPAKKKKHCIKFEAKLAKKQATLQDFIDYQLNIKKWRNKDSVEKKIATMIGKRPWKSVLIPTIQGDEGQITVTIDVDLNAKQQYENTLGKSILFTNLKGHDPSDLIWSYREQYLIERAFSLMKDPQTIAIRPIFVSNPQSIEGHIFICIIALWLLALLRYKLCQKGIAVSYDQIVRDLRRVHVTRVHILPTNSSFLKLDKVPARMTKYIALLHLDALIKEG
jgi:transposase